MKQQFAFCEVVSRAIKSFSLEYNEFLVHISCDLCPIDESEGQMALSTPYSSIPCPYYYIVIIVMSYVLYIPIFNHKILKN